MKKDYDSDKGQAPSDQSKPQKKEKRPSFIGRMFALIITAVLILGAVILVTYRDIWDIDALARTITYRNLTLSETGQAESFLYRQGNSIHTEALGNDLLVCSESTALIYSESGTLYVNDVLSYGNPIVDIAGEMTLIYDCGGEKFIVYGDRMEQYSITLDSTETILSASINESGWVVATLRDISSKGYTTVYNQDGTVVMEVSLSSAFLMGATINPDCTQVALLTVDLADGVFDSSFSFYSLTGDETSDSAPLAVYSLGNTILLDFYWSDDGLWCLGDQSITLLTSNTDSVTPLEFTQPYLESYSLQGDGFAMLLLGSDQWGTSTQLTTHTADGEATSLMLSDPVLSTSVAGSYIAVLTSDILTIYTPDLDVYCILEDTQGAETVLMRSDGSALLLDSQTARLYIP